MYVDKENGKCVEWSKTRFILEREKVVYTYFVNGAGPDNNNPGLDWRNTFLQQLSLSLTTSIQEFDY